MPTMQPIRTNPPATVPGSEAAKAIAKLVDDHRRMSEKFNEARMAQIAAERGVKAAADADAKANGAAMLEGKPLPGPVQVTANKAEQERAKAEAIAAESAMTASEQKIEDLLREHGGEFGDWTQEAHVYETEARAAAQAALRAAEQAIETLGEAEAVLRWMTSRGRASSTVPVRNAIVGGGSDAVSKRMPDLFAAMRKTLEPPAPVKPVAPELAAIAAR